MQNLADNMMDPNTHRVVNTQLDEFRKTAAVYTSFMSELAKRKK